MTGACQECVTCTTCGGTFCLSDPVDVPVCDHGELVCNSCWPKGCALCEFEEAKRAFVVAMVPIVTRICDLVERAGLVKKP